MSLHHSILTSCGSFLLSSCSSVCQPIVPPGTLATPRCVKTFIYTACSVKPSPLLTEAKRCVVSQQHTGKWMYFKVIQDDLINYYLSETKHFRLEKKEKRCTPRRNSHSPGHIPFRVQNPFPLMPRLARVLPPLIVQGPLRKVPLALDICQTRCE